MFLKFFFFKFAADNGGGIKERKQLLDSLATEDGTFLHMATKVMEIVNEINRKLMLKLNDSIIRVGYYVAGTCNGKWNTMLIPR